MQRTRVYDFMVSRGPSLLGLCKDNLPGICGYINSAQQRLLYAREAMDEGWWGTWAEIVFNVSREQPYITFPRDIARLQSINVCNVPVFVQNQFFEYLSFGNGRMPKTQPWCNGNGIGQNAFTRNNAITFLEMTNAPQYITAYATDAQDKAGLSRVLIQGLDANGNTVYSQDVDQNVTGVFLTLQSPSITTPMTFSSINGIQKDITVGPVRFYQHDPTTGDEILLLTMEPSEQTASYRRYYLHNLPCNCCPNPSNSTQVQVTAIAKLELIPVLVQTDYLLIQNREAIIEECQSIRYSQMDDLRAKQMAAERHKQAIGLLNGELCHYLGMNTPAVGLFPFGSARLERQKIGLLI